MTFDLDEGNLHFKTIEPKLTALSKIVTYLIHFRELVPVCAFPR